MSLFGSTWELPETTKKRQEPAPRIAKGGKGRQGAPPPARKLSEGAVAASDT